MDGIQWRGYYSQMILRGVKPEKIREFVANCGGQKQMLVPDPTDPQKQVEQIEPFEEAVERIRGEILEISSRESLAKKANGIITELRRR